VIEIANDSFLRAARGESVERTPIWIMRQAGRVLPEYLAVREKYSFLDVAQIPEVCADVTTQPVDRLGVDAAILFSDILMPLPALGIGVDFKPGPILERTHDPAAGVGAFRRPDPTTDWTFLRECVEATIAKLDGRVPLIGFAGAPFTVATYLLEGPGSKQHIATRRFLHSDPDGFRDLLFFLADRLAEWLQVQIDAGVAAFQLFDSWAGVLSPADQAEFSLPAARRVLEKVSIPAGFPTIYFAPGAGGAIAAQAEVGTTVLGVDWRTDLASVRAAFPDKPLQGNLDPGVLLGPPGAIERGVRSVLDAAGPTGGHVFNLGHGILPETPVENAERFVQLVHQLSEERR
jgi:uroporphyrinogen decarboxylase